jgi:hypothetical protein
MSSPLLNQLIENMIHDYLNESKANKLAARIQAKQDAIRKEKERWRAKGETGYNPKEAKLKAELDALHYKLAATGY